MNYLGVIAMGIRTCTIALLLVLFLPQAGGLAAQEFLTPVNGGRAEQLSSYNSDFLTKELYFASRHRIVRVNADVLKGEQITLRPFDDVRPIQIKRTSVYETDGAIYWSGVTSDEVPVFISTLSWDLDPEGIASPSNQNRSSPWKINEQGVPVLDVRPGDPPGIAGPPPRTPQQIEDARRLQGLTRKAFQSVEAIVIGSDGTRYAIKPLEYVPRYALVYEIDPAKELNLPRDNLSRDNRAENEKRRAEEYHQLARTGGSSKNEAPAFWVLCSLRR